MSMKVEVVGGKCIEEGRGLYGCQSSQVVNKIKEVRCKKLAVIPIEGGGAYNLGNDSDRKYPVHRVAFSSLSK
jgi:hypothetical protein